MNESDASHHLRSFGADLVAEFEDGESLGVVHATMVRPFSEPDADGHFENGEFWGLVEFSNEIGDSAVARLARGDLVRLRSDADRKLPASTLVVEPVRDVRGDRPRWLAHEIRR